jgi:hypothetical protein
MEGTTTLCLAAGREQQLETEVENDSPALESGPEVSSSSASEYS